MDTGEEGHIRTGTVWTGTSHAVTAMVGSGILALPWCLSQLGWILGPLLILTFAAITYFSALLLSDCYRSPHPIHGSRNYTYTHAIRTILGEKKVMICGMMQYSLLWGTMIGFTITTSISIAAMMKLTCNKKGHRAKCEVSGNLYMAIFGALEIFLSQCPNLEKATILSVIAAVTSFIYASIAFGLSVSTFFSHPQSRGSLMVAKTNQQITTSVKIWRIFQALGDIAFSYTYSILQLEIQNTLKSPPPENKTMKKVSLYAITVTTAFYVSLACFGYATFGSEVKGNILTEFQNPIWIVNIGNLALIIHLIGGYQVFAQPVFAIHEKWLASKWPTSFINRVYTMRLSCKKDDPYMINFTVSRLLLRTIFVIFTTSVAMMFPFFNAVLGVLGSISFWPLTIYFPLSMYMVQFNIRRGSSTWVFYMFLNLVCVVVSIIALVGSIADILERLQHTKLFHIQA